MRNWLVLFVLAFLSFAAQAVADSVAVAPIGAARSNVNYWGGPWFDDTYGFYFIPTETFTITALGVYNDGNNNRVGLWSSSGALLLDITVHPGDGFVLGDFRFVTLATPYTVTATGNYYEVGAEMANGDVLKTGHYSVTLDLRIGDIFRPAKDGGPTGVVDPAFGGGWHVPTVSTEAWGYGDWVFGANFLIGNNTVPEPGTWALLGVALLGILALRRKWA